MNNHSHQALLPIDIPLHCNICPKKPDFSDVSHLLTHIASKGHLSHYYKMKVKASTEAVAKQMVDEYDQWYEEWNVQDLMRERMSQKERKKGGSGANGTPANSNGSRRTSVANSTGSRTARSTPMPAPFPTRRSFRESTLDPQLDRMIKQEPKSRSTTPNVPYHLDPATMSRQYAPPMQAWSATQYVDSPMMQDRSVLDSLYSTPTSDSMEDLLPRRASGRRGQRNLSESNPSIVPEEEPELEFDDGHGEHTKLKGAIWPGMGLFDSAKQEMRRKRNQKKAVSVVENLQATSEGIEATEFVFDSEGVLRRERPITGNPDEEDGMSPLKGESSPVPEFPPAAKKKTTRKPRPALTEKDVNTSRTTKRRGESHHPPFGNSTRSTPYFDGSQEDDELTYGRPRPAPTRRTTLSIHRDNSGPDITFENPAPMNTLTSGFRTPFQHSSSLQHRGHPALQNTHMNRNHGREPSLNSGGGFRPTQQNPLATFQPPNFGSFGQLTGQSMFHNINFHTSNSTMPLPNGHHALPAVQNHFGFVPNHFGAHIDSFQPQNNTGPQIPASWDVFGLGQQDMNIPGGPDGGFQMNADLTSVNPLFFSSNHAAPEDDEATISPPSERGGR